jgi:hypothetical protein
MDFVGWDPVSGLGSPVFAEIARQLGGPAPTPGPIAVLGHLCDEYLLVCIWGPVCAVVCTSIGYFYFRFRRAAAAEKSREDELSVTLLSE